VEGGRAGSEERGVKDSPTSLHLAPSTLREGEAGRRGELQLLIFHGPIGLRWRGVLQPVTPLVGGGGQVAALAAVGLALWG
jgi:hypothetical protein